MMWPIHPFLSVSFLRCWLLLVTSVFHWRQACVSCLRSVIWRLQPQPPYPALESSTSILPILAGTRTSAAGLTREKSSQREPTWSFFLTSTCQFAWRRWRCASRRSRRSQTSPTSRCCATYWSACSRRRTLRQTAPRSCTSSTLSSAPFGPLVAACSRIRWAFFLTMYSQDRDSLLRRSMIVRHWFALCMLCYVAIPW